MSPLRRGLLTVVIAALWVLSACHGPRVEIGHGDRIIFLGDSITELGDRPDGYVSMVRDTLAARYPDLGLEVIGAGVSGNKVPDLEERLYQDVLSLNPTVVFVYIGINDVWHSTMVWGGTPVDRYEAGLRSILGRITAAGARPLICTPTLIGELPDGGNFLDSMLDEYAAVSRRVARDMDVPLVDLRKTFLRYLLEHNPGTLEKGVLTYDGVHLRDTGNHLVAEEILGVLYH